MVKPLSGSPGLLVGLSGRRARRRPLKQDKVFFRGSRVNHKNRDPFVRLSQTRPRDYDVRYTHSADKVLTEETEQVCEADRGPSFLRWCQVPGARCQQVTSGRTESRLGSGVTSGVFPEDAGAETSSETCY